jgi:hypothetical protein
MACVSVKARDCRTLPPAPYQERTPKSKHREERSSLELAFSLRIFGSGIIMG